MEKIFFCLLVLGSRYAVAQQTYVPDDNFEQALIDLGHDNVLGNDVNFIVSLNLDNRGISNLRGLQDFRKLTVLSGNKNQTTSIFFCGFNQLRLVQN